VLLTVSGTIADGIDAEVAKGARPRADYLELARAMEADLLDVPAARIQAGRLGRAIERLAGAGGLLAWAAFQRRQHYDTIVTDGEQVGLPLALLGKLTRRRSCRHVMIVHIISAPKKVLLYRLLRPARHIDAMIVYSSWQQTFITEELGFPADRVELSPFMVDTRFFSAEQVTPRPERMICAAGLERRDYDTFVDAVRGMDVRVVIAAASPWSKQADGTRGRELPPNVEVCSLGFVDLRQLYADACFVVMPLHDVEFQAGVTTILEAMAMGKAVVCSRTRGQTDVIEDGTTGVYVPPVDAAELRAAIKGLLDDPNRADEIGARGRRYVEEECDVAVYARRLADVVSRSADPRTKAGGR
jgi:glycosyltransferase involved in cell wall biosynthesis